MAYPCVCVWVDGVVCVCACVCVFGVGVCVCAIIIIITMIIMFNILVSKLMIMSYRDKQPKKQFPFTLMENFKVTEHSKMVQCAECSALDLCFFANYS